MILADYRRRFIIDLIEIRRQRLRSIMDNLFHSYIKYVILAYSKPPSVSNCYRALKEIDTILEQVEKEIMRNNGVSMEDRVAKLLFKAKRIATSIGGETQIIIEDLIESIRLFYNK